jgi:glycosyltransferase involved in cell wall biosynthesis
MTHYCPWSNSVAKTLQSFGHEVHVFDFADTTRTEFLHPCNSYIADDFAIYVKHLSGVHLIRSPIKSKLRYVYGARLLHRLAKAIQADVVLTLYGGGFGLMAYLSGIRPYAVYIMGCDVLSIGGAIKAINRVVLASAAQVFANGEYLASKALQQSPVAKVLTLLIGVDLTSLRMADFSIRPVRLICAREFDDIYNNDSIIRAVSKLPENIPDFRLIFVSGGPGLQRSIELADSIMPARHRERVSFWGGVSYEKVLDGLYNSHISLSMSTSDGTSTAILEAMGSGLFPILSDIPQNRALIRSGESNGILVPLNNDAALADAISSAIRNIEQCTSYAAFNRQRIKEIADGQKNRKVLAQRLEDIVLAGSRHKQR